MQNIATQAERSANNPSQQTTQTLAIFDNTLSSVADFVSEANTSVIDVMVSKIYSLFSASCIVMACVVHSCVRVMTLNINIGRGECCRYY